MKAVKFILKNKNLSLTTWVKKQTAKSQHQTKHMVTVLSKHQKISINAIQIPLEIPPFIEMFYIPNLSVAIPIKFLSDEGEKYYIEQILQNVAVRLLLVESSVIVIFCIIFLMRHAVIINY